MRIADIFTLCQTNMYIRNTPYFAISHVWADGLGNSQENGLPECQVRHLHNLLTQTQWRARRSCELVSCTLQRGLWGKDKYIWMDTFCIPPNDSSVQLLDFDDVKRLAIHNMNMVYATSMATLVLDSELQQHCNSSTQTSKLLAYIRCCGWTTRSWTLQEAGLAPETMYAVGNEIKRLQGRKIKGWSLEDQLVRRLKCLVLADGQRVWKRRRLNEAEFYTRTWNELLHRISGEQIDVPAILANMLGASTYRVLQQKTESQRIGVMIRQHRKLPVSILYNTGPRLKASLEATVQGTCR
jgi:hypothetical protein